MKAIILAEGNLASHYLGPSVFAFNQAKALRRKNVDVAMLELDMRSPRRRRKIGFGACTVDGIPVYTMAVPCGPVPFVLPLLSKTALLHSFNKAARLFGPPDVIHAHFGNIGAVCSVLSRKNAPIILTEHSSAVIRENRDKGAGKVFRRAYDTADTIITVSTALKKRMADLTDKDIRVIPNVLASHFAYGHTVKNNDFTFISVGNLIESKRFDITITAFGRVNVEYPDIKLKIVGEGVLKGRLMQIARENCVDEKAEFLGIVPNAMLPEVYGSCHCFVLPSMYETFGVAYAEALACGLPVIATRCGGPEDFVDDGNGMLIPVDDLEATVGAMRHMYENYSVYDSEGISRGIVGKLNEDAIGRAICEVYSETLRIQPGD